MKRTKKSAKIQKRKRTTMKSSSSRPTKNNVVETLLQVLNDVKVYHWNTRSFAQHKATDELYQRLGDNIDKFVEVLLGKQEDRLKLQNLRILNTTKINEIKSVMCNFRSYLIAMDKCFDEKSDSDLLSIRDDILTDVNQFMYLLTLKG
jgi:DNA-binding ferritin-like protein